MIDKYGNKVTGRNIQQLVITLVAVDAVNTNLWSQTSLMGTKSVTMGDYGLANYTDIIFRTSGT